METRSSPKQVFVKDKYAHTQAHIIFNVLLFLYIPIKLFELISNREKLHLFLHATMWHMLTFKRFDYKV
jgi:hypothetical protein